MKDKVKALIRKGIVTLLITLLVLVAISEHNRTKNSNSSNRGDYSIEEVEQTSEVYGIDASMVENSLEVLLDKYSEEKHIKEANKYLVDNTKSEYKQCIDEMCQKLVRLCKSDIYAKDIEVIDNESKIACIMYMKNDRDCILYLYKEDSKLIGYRSYVKLEIE